MPAKLHDTGAEHDELAETTPAGVTRRELFHIGNVLALPVLVGGVRGDAEAAGPLRPCLLYTSPSPRDRQKSRMPSSA